jgi:hypothetical protein
MTLLEALDARFVGHISQLWAQAGEVLYESNNGI